MAKPRINRISPQALEEYKNTGREWNKLSAGIEYEKAKPAESNGESISQGQSEDESIFGKAYDWAAEKVSDIAGAVRPAIQHPIDFITGSSKTLLNGIDGTVITQLDGTSNATIATQNQALNDISASLKDPEFKSLLDYVTKWQDQPEALKGIDIKTKKGLNIEADLKNNKYNIDYPALISGTAPKGPTSLYENISSDSKSQLPGLHEIPDAYKDAYVKYSGLLKKYLDTREEAKSGIFDKIGLAVKGTLTGGPTRYAELPTLDKLSKLNDLSEDQDTKVIQDYMKSSYDNNVKEINGRLSDISARTKDISSFFKHQQEIGNPVYQEAEQIGSSLSLMKSQLPLIAFNVATSYLAAQVGNEGLASKQAIAALNGVVNFVGEKYNRDSESYSEFGDYRQQRMDYLLKDKALSKRSDVDLVSISVPTKDANDITQRANKELTESGKLNPQTRIDLERAINNGMVQTTDKDVSNAIKESSRQAKEYLNQQYSNVAWDMAEIGLMATPFGNDGKFIKRAVEGAAEESISKNALKSVIRNTKEWLTNKGEKLAAMKISPYVSAAGRFTLANIMEGLEESQQYIQGQRYVHGDLRDNESLIGSIADGYFHQITGARSLLGFGVDEKYINRAENAQNFNSGFVMSALMGAAAAPMHIGSYIDDKKRSKAEKFVDGVIAQSFDSEMQLAKTDKYVDISAKGKGAHIINRMTEMIRNNDLPEGITADQMEDEIRSAREAFSIADDKNILKYIKDTSKYGSQEHKDIVSLAHAHMRDLNIATDALNEHNTNISEKTNTAIKDNPILSSYFESLNNSREDENKLSEHNVAKISEYKSRLDTVNKAIALAEQSKADEKTNNVKTTLQDRYYRSGLVNMKKGLENTIKSMAALNSLDKDELEGIPLMASDNKLNQSLTVATAAQAGITYDRTMLNGFLGYKAIMKSGRPAYIKMDSEEHSKFLSSKSDEFRKARNGEDKIHDEQEAHDNTATTEKKDSKDIVPSSTAEEQEVPLSKKEAENVQAPVGQEVYTSPSEDLYAPAQKPISPQEGLEGAVDVPMSYETEEGVHAIEEDDVEAILNKWESFNSKTEGAPSKEESKDSVSAEQSVNSDTVEESGIVEQAYSEPDSSMIEDVEESLPGSTTVIQSTKRDKLSHTLFTDPTTPEGQAILSIIEKGVNEKRGLSDYDLEVVVTQFDKPFALSDPNSWDNASIAMKMTGKDGKVLYLRLKTPYTAAMSTKTVGVDTVPLFSPDEIESLRSFRNSILSMAKEMNKNSFDTGIKFKLVPEGIEIGNGQIDVNRDAQGNSIQRGIDEINGFGLPMNHDGTVDFTKLGLLQDKEGNPNLDIAIGRGVKGTYEIVNIFGRNYASVPDESTITTQTNTGNIFITIKSKFTGNRIPVKVNPAQLSRLDESFTDLIVDLVLDKRAATDGVVSVSKTGIVKESDAKASTSKRTPFTANKLLKMLINFGDNTIVDDKHRNKDFLVAKEFYIDESNVLHLGSDITVNLNTPISDEQRSQVADYIKNNMHFSIDKDNLWSVSEETGSRYKTVAEAYPELDEWFESNTEPFVIAKGIQFTPEDMKLTWAAWIIKNRLLTSDLKDGLLKTPYVYLNGVKTIEVGTDANVSIDGGSSLKTSENAPQGPSTNPFTKEEKSIPENTENKTVEQAISDIKSEPTQTEKKGRRPRKAAGEKTYSINDFVDKVEVKTDEVNKPDNSGPAREARDSHYQRMDAEREVSWLMDKLGLSDEDISIAADVISIAGDKKAMGLMHGDSITLWRGAEVGTSYHEAFHRVSLMLMNRRERLQMYNAAREQYPELKNATKDQIEESLAEKFREHVLAGKTSSDKYGIRRAFRRISNFVRSLFNLKPRDLTRIYENIELGIYKKSAVNKESAADFKEAYGDYAAKSISSMKISSMDVNQFYNAINGLSYMLFKINGVESIEDIDKIDFNKLYDAISDLAYEAEDAGNESRAAVFDEILERFDDVFKPEVVKSLYYMGVREIDNDTKDEESSNITSEEISKFKASYETSYKDNIRTEIKVFVSTMPEVQMKDGVVESISDPLTGFNKFYPFDIAWNTMVYDLNSELTPETMKSKVNDLAATSPFYKMLSEKLEKADDDFITKFWGTMFSNRHEFVNVSYRRSLEEEYIGDSSWTIRDSDIDAATKVIPETWGHMLSGDSDVYMYSKEQESTVFNPSSIQSIINDFYSFRNTLSDRGISENISKFVDIMNRAGIMIDGTTISHMFKDSENKENAFNNYVKMSAFPNKWAPDMLFKTILPKLIENGGKYMIGKKDADVAKIFAKEAFAKKLAIAYAESHPTPEEVTILGADDAKLYSISLNNYASDAITYLNKDDSFLRNMLKVTYNVGRNTNGSANGSLALRQMNRAARSGKKLKLSLKTFVKLYEDGSGDKGADYFKISSAEDYMVKMTALSNNYLVFPTMADKKTYNFLHGLELFNGDGTNIEYERYTRTGTTMGVKIKFPDKVVSQFEEYLFAEFMSIKEEWARVKSANGNKAKLIKGYHYGGVDSQTGMKWADGHGNALRFRHMDMVSSMLNHNETNRDTMPSLNEFIDACVKGDSNPSRGMDSAIERLEALLFSDSENSVNFRRADINANLKDALDRELSYADELGIINFNGEYSSLSNRLLDKKQMARESRNYERSTNAIDKTTGKPVVSYSEQAAILNMISHNLFNGIVSIVEFEKLISKDPAYYKDADAKIKRLSSILSTGNNLRTSWPKGHRLQNRQSFTVSEMLDNQMSSRVFDKLSNMFIAGEVNDLMRANKKEPIPNLIGILSNPDMSDVLKTYEEANPAEFKFGREIASKNVGGYGNGGINETDATVFITPSMFRDIKEMLGEWNPEMEEAFNIIEADDQSWMDDDEKASKVAKLTMQPLKMIYFGDTFGGGIDVPVLDKMAMFPLFKSFATGDLSSLYDRMNATESEQMNGLSKIDMVPFDSAVKVGNSQAMSMYSDASNNEIADLSKMVVTNQEFKYLRKQLITDPHHQSELSLGTQVNKGAMSNIVRDKVYSNIEHSNGTGMTGTEIIDNWLNANIELSNRGKQRLSTKFGITKDDKTGEFGFDKKKLFNLLIEDAKSSKVTNDVIEEMMKVADGTKSNSLQSLMDNKLFESRLVSLISKDVIDINTKGGMFIQQTPFGVKSIDVAKARSGIMSIGEFNSRNKGRQLINNGEPLNFLNPDGSMDCVISINLFKDVIPSSIKSFNKRKQWLIDNNIIGPNAKPMAVGYRVPTQGLSSISALRASDVLPAFHGDKIILPSEFTKITGSDFDIDKLYLARHSYKNGEKVKFDDNAELTLTKNDGTTTIVRDKWKANSEDAIRNRLLDTYMAVLTEPTTIHESRVPLDTATDELKDVILPDIEKSSVKDTDFKSYYFASPMFQSKKKAEYTTGKSGIGPFALNNANHVLTQMTGLKFVSKGAIAKFGLESLSDIKGRDNMRILDWLSAMINAHVDVAKDTYIIRLNVNPFTYNMVTLLLRTGIGGGTFYFTSQPILKEMSNELSKTVGRYGVDDSTSRTEKENEITEGLVNKYAAIAMQKAGKDKAKIDALSVMLSSEGDKLQNQMVLDKSWLTSQLRDDPNSFEHYYNQILVMKTFKELKPSADALAELVKASQIDTKKYGTSFTSMRLFSKLVDSIKNKGEYSEFVGIDDYFSKTFIDAKLDNSMFIANTLGSGMFFRTTRSVENFIDNSLRKLGYRTQSEELTSKMSGAVDAFIKSEFYKGLANDRQVHVKDMFFGPNTMAKRLIHITKLIAEDDNYKYLSENTLLKSIRPDSAMKDSGNADHIVLKNSKSNDGDLVNKMKMYWSEMLTDPNKLISDFAKDLILYEYFTSGENNTLNLLKLGEDDRADLGIHDFINAKMDEFKSSYSAFDNQTAVLEDILSNKWYDDELVPTIQTTKESKTSGQYIDGEWHPDTITSDYVESSIKYDGVNTYPLIIIDSFASKVDTDYVLGDTFKPMVKVKLNRADGGTFTVLYKQVGTVAAPTKNNPRAEKPVYIAIDKKSDKKSGKYIVEYGFKQSMIPSNILEQKASFDNIRTTDDAKSYVRSLFEIRNASIPGFKLSKDHIDKIVNRFDSYYPIGLMESDVSEKESISKTQIDASIKEAVDNSIKSNDFGVDNLVSTLENRGANDAEIMYAQYHYADALLSSLGDALSDNYSENIEVLAGKRSSTIREYLQYIKDSNSEYAKVMDEVENIESEIDKESSIESEVNDYSDLDAINKNMEMDGIGDMMMSKEQWDGLSQEEKDKLKECYGS